MKRIGHSLLGAAVFFAVSFGAEYGRILYWTLRWKRAAFAVVGADGAARPQSTGIDMWPFQAESAFVALLVGFFAFLVVYGGIGRWFRPGSPKRTAVSCALAAIVPIVLMRTEYFCYGGILSPECIAPPVGYGLLGAAGAVVAVAVARLIGRTSAPAG